ncbi:MAG: penicillin-binding protein 2 [Bacillota bacterium]|nr:penicillin-binding protein 2 [Bacillota bacterium]
MLSRRRINLIIFIFSFIFFLLALKVFYIQFFEGQKLFAEASAQRISTAKMEKSRGQILDKNFIPFTSRTTKTSVVLEPLLLRGKGDLILKLSNALKLDFGSLKREIEFKKAPILIDIDEESKNQALGLKTKGVSLLNSLQRYGQASVLTHVLGYLNQADQNGASGLEKSYENILKECGEDSLRVVTDANDNILQGIGYRIIKSGDLKKELNLKLTIDYHIQKKVEDIMKKNNLTGAVVVEDVNTGNIAAMASMPDFDQNDVGKYLQSPKNELFNRAVASYNIGSIFKIIDVAEALESGVSLDNNYLCTGVLKLGDREFRCSSFENGGHGYIGFSDAFAKSCNSYFIDLGLKLGYQKLLTMADKFGLGKITGLRSQGVDEASGNLPPIKHYYTDGDIANMSIGQGGIMTTPVQIANLVATVANGGIKNQVNIVDSIIDENGKEVKRIRKDGWERVISKSTSDRIRSLMEEVVTSGTGTKAKPDGILGAGGKTGSAETGLYINGEKVVHAWFAGYFPSSAPKYSVAVFVENGKSGGQAAAPIFKEIAEACSKE